MVVLKVSDGGGLAAGASTDIMVQYSGTFLAFSVASDGFGYDWDGTGL